MDKEKEDAVRFKDADMRVYFIDGLYGCHNGFMLACNDGASRCTDRFSVRILGHRGWMERMDQGEREEGGKE